MQSPNPKYKVFLDLNYRVLHYLSHMVCYPAKQLGLHQTRKTRPFPLIHQGRSSAKLFD